jgi:YaiO family outer membrane protein
MKYCMLILLVLIRIVPMVADTADSLIAVKDFPAAEAVLSARLSEHPQNDDLRLRLAYVQAWQHHYEAAIRNFNRVLERRKDDPDGIIGLANCYLWQDDARTARQIVVEAQSRTPREEYRAWLQKLNARESTPPEYRLDIDGEYASTSDDEYWNSESLRGSVKLYRAIGLQSLSTGLQRERYHRWDATDETNGLILYVKPWSRFTIGNELILGEHNSFLPRLKWHSNVFFKPVADWETIASIGYTLSDYHTDTTDKQVSMMQIGTEYYLPRESMLAARYYLTLNSGHDNGSFLLMGQTRLDRHFTASASFSAGTEFLDATLGSSTSWSTGGKLVWEPRNGLMLSAGMGYEKWDSGLIRRYYRGGIGTRF